MPQLSIQHLLASSRQTPPADHKSAEESARPFAEVLAAVAPPPNQLAANSPVQSDTAIAPATDLRLPHEGDLSLLVAEDIAVPVEQLSVSNPTIAENAESDESTGLFAAHALNNDPVSENPHPERAGFTVTDPTRPSQPSSINTPPNLQPGAIPVDALAADQIASPAESPMRLAEAASTLAPTQPPAETLPVDVATPHESKSNVGTHPSSDPNHSIAAPRANRVPTENAMAQVDLGTATGFSPQAETQTSPSQASHTPPQVTQNDLVQPAPDSSSQRADAPPAERLVRGTNAGDLKSESILQVLDESARPANVASEQQFSHDVEEHLRSVDHAIASTDKPAAHPDEFAQPTDGPADMSVSNDGADHSLTQQNDRGNQHQTADAGTSLEQTSQVRQSDSSQIQNIDESIRLSNQQSPATDVAQSDATSESSQLIGAAGKAKRADAATQVVAGLRQVVSHSDASGNKTVTLQLQPEELGQLKILIEQTPEAINTQIIATEAIASELLGTQKDALVTALNELGFDNASVDVSHQRSEQSNDQSDFQSDLPGQRNHNHRQQSGDPSGNDAAAEHSPDQSLGLDLVA